MRAPLRPRPPAALAHAGDPEHQRATIELDLLELSYFTASAKELLALIKKRGW